MSRKYEVFAKIELILLLSLFACGCSTTDKSVAFSKSELHLIPASSLQRLVSAHSENEIAYVRLSGQRELLVVKEFKSRDTAIVFGLDGNEMAVPLKDISDLLLSKRPETARQFDRQSKSNSGAASSGVGEALIYAPVVPIAIVTWPVASAMGIDESKNSLDRKKANMIYLGMSRDDLLANVGSPKEKYVCVHKLRIPGRPDVPEEVWVYDEDKVLRGGRTLFIDIDKGVVIYGSPHTTFFRNPDSFDCSAIDAPMKR